MSKIIRHVTDAPVVFIGERQRDILLERKASRRLSELFPIVSCLTDADGALMIPVQEVLKIEEELNKKKVEAFEEGFKKGYQQGLEKGRDEARNVLSQFDRAIKDTIAQREQIFEESRNKILELVLQISRKVTFDAIEIDQDATVTMINRIIDQLVDRSCLKIKVHPDHLPIVEQNINRFLLGSASIKEIKIEADPRVRFGGCFIETPSGDIDARLESAFEVIAEGIRGEGEHQ